jgi:uncharacterized cupin superfamily protein
VGIAHIDEVRQFDFELGHLRGRWSFAGQAAGCHTVGMSRIEVPAGGFSTPVHEHGRGEEIFLVQTEIPRVLGTERTETPGCSS